MNALIFEIVITNAYAINLRSGQLEELQYLCHKLCLRIK
jgi:hypothetical protein